MAKARRTGVVDQTQARAADALAKHVADLAAEVDAEREAAAAALPSTADAQARGEADAARDGGAGFEAEPEPILDIEQARLASNDEWAFQQADRLQKRMPPREGRADRRTEGEVFDRQTLLTLHKLLTHGVLRSLDYPVSTGKEANVFRGTTPRGGYVAVKIYRINTATFKHVLQYIQGDERFEGVTGDRRSLVHAWCQKEFRNLARLREAGVSVPEPIKAIHNVLVMEYLGVKSGPFPTLKEASQGRRLDDAQRLWQMVADDYVRSYNQAGLVHADLSEYNIMLDGANGPEELRRPRIMDVGQAVLHSHPMAREFAERDIKNLVAFFRRQGADADGGQITSRMQSPDPSLRRDMMRAEKAAARLNAEGSEE